MKDIIKSWLTILLIVCSVTSSSCTSYVNEKTEMVKKNLSSYKSILLAIQNQSDVDYIWMSENSYTFTRGETVYSGTFNLEKNEITQTHYKGHFLSDTDKLLIQKWVKYLKENKIFGFDIRSQVIMKIFVTPEAELLFLDEYNYDDAWKNMDEKWEDYRGVTHCRIEPKIYLIFEK